MSLLYPGGVITKSPATTTNFAAGGVWTMNQATQAIRGGVWPGAATGDPYYNQTTLLLQGQGTNGAQNNTFLDSSSNNFTITRNGNTTQGTFTPFSEPNGYWGYYFDGSSRLYNGTTVSLGSSDFCMEAWYYSSNTSDVGLFSQRTNGNANGWTFNLGKFSALVGASWLDPVVGSSSYAVANQWTHVCVTRIGNNFTFFVNGKAVSTATASGSIADQNVPTIGAAGAGGEGSFTGYISNLRVCVGYVPLQYQASSFTPSTTPLTTSSQGMNPNYVRYLTCQSNRFVDNSNNAFALSITGSPSVQPFQPFGSPSSVYSATTNGGAGYFDGTGDYLTASYNSAFDLSTGDFTIDGWFYATSSTGYRPIISLYGGSGTQWIIALNGANYDVYVYPVGTSLAIYAGSAPAQNQWVHFALVRDGANFKFFSNGALAATVASQTLRSVTQDLGVGTASAGTYLWIGYTSGLRIVKGTAVYTAAFTPPTSPPTAITNTSLLLNYTNSGIFDATGDNDLETVGNAQISTTQYKYGSSSMYFDGTGDWLFTNVNLPNYTFGSGDFTVETWLYTTTVAPATLVSVFDTRPASTQGAYTLFYLNTDGTIRLWVSSADRITTQAISANTWYHVALCRVSGSTRIFINGVQSGSTYTDSNTYLASNLIVGGSYGGGASIAYSWNGYMSDFRITKGIGRYPYNFTPPQRLLPNYYLNVPPQYDPYFNYTSLLLPGNGTNGAQNNTFLDSSSNNFTITRNGNTTQGTFTPFSQPDGWWSNYFDGSSRLRATASSLSSSSFTIEAWVYYTGSSGSNSAIYDFANAVDGYGTYLGHTTAGNISVQFYSNNTGTLIGQVLTSFAGNYNRWVHLAVTYDGSTYRLFVNGSSVGTSVSSATQVVSINSLTIGARSDTAVATAWSGYISNFRYVTGAALYTSNFTPTTVPLAIAASGTTRLLTCQSNRFIDNSSSPYTFTISGSPSVQSFFPFVPTAPFTAYSTLGTGGSGYFDGTGDYLSLSSNAAWNVSTNAFTVECWVYTSSSLGSSVGLVSAGYNTNFHLQIDNTSNIYFWIANSNILATNVVKPNTWTHIVAARGASNAVAIWVNGTRVQSGTLSGTGSQQALYVGTSSHATTEVMYGYMSGVKFVNGTDVYGVTNTSITVPTAPPTDTTNTKLLCNFTNSGIYDAASKNDLETVGDAKISTTVSKWGGSSMYFDGTGDQLVAPNNINLYLGGPFTIEGWFYLTSTGADRVICQYLSGTADESTQSYLVRVNSSDKLLVGVSVSTNFYYAITTTSIAANTWYYFAATLDNSSSGTLRIFLNGNLEGTAAVTGTMNNPSGSRLYVGSRISDRYWIGYIQDIRITKGVARYQYNFTPPTAAFPIY